MAVIGKGLGLLADGAKAGVDLLDDLTLDGIISAAENLGVKLDVFEGKKGLELSKIVVPEKSKGVGTSIMNDLSTYADKTGQAISLSPSTDFGGSSKKRLTDFYKRFGFVQNKGKNKDFTVSNSMYRTPEIKSNPAAGATAAGMGLLGSAAKVGRGILDMSTPARMARADDMGFDADKDWYHGTADDIEEFLKSKRGSGTQANSAKKAFWFTDDAETTARSYADHSGTTNKVAALIKEADTAERAGNWDLYDKKLQEAEELESFFMGANENRLQGQNIIPTKLPKDEGLFTVDMKGESFSDGAFGGVNEALDKAKAQGYKGVKFLNLDDAIGHSNKPATHVAIFEPQNIRSKFAKFDPAEANSTSILASKPVAGVGAGVLGAIGASQSNKTYADYSPANLARLRSNDVGSIQAPQSMAASNIAGLMGSANKVGYDDSLLGMVAPQLPSELMNKIAYNDKRGLMDYAKAYAGLLGF